MVFEFSKCSSDEMSSLLLPSWLRWKHVEEIISVGPHRFMSVHFWTLNSDLSILQALTCFSKLLKLRPSNMFCLFIEIYWSIIETILKYYWRVLKEPSSQIGSAWEWYDWIVLEKDINSYRFSIFFKFYLEIFKRLQSSEPLHTKIHLILLLVGITGCMATNRNLFPPNWSPKMRESQQLSFGLWLVRRIFEESLTSLQSKPK
jgi:hypothetical protein